MYNTHYSVPTRILLLYLYHIARTSVYFFVSLVGRLDFDLQYKYNIYESYYILSSGRGPSI